MTDGERTIRQVLARSAGTCNQPTDYAMKMITDMIDNGQASRHDAMNAGGPWLDTFLRAYYERESDLCGSEPNNDSMRVQI